MGDQNNAADEFFSKFDNEEENLTDFSDSLPETKEVEAKEAPEVKANPKETKEDTSKEADTKTEEDKDLPFHKHPRFKEINDEKKSLREEKLEWDKQKQEMQDRLDALENKPLTDEELEGMTPKEIQEHTRKELERENAKKQELSTKEKEDADKYITDSLNAIKDTGFDLNEDTENEILKYADEYTEGNITKAFELYQKFHQTKESGKEEEAKESAKKKAAESNKSNKGSSGKVGGFKRGQSWSTVNSNMK